MFQILQRCLVPRVEPSPCCIAHYSHAMALCARPLSLGAPPRSLLTPASGPELGDGFRVRFLALRQPGYATQKGAPGPPCSSSAARQIVVNNPLPINFAGLEAVPAVRRGNAGRPGSGRVKAQRSRDPDLGASYSPHPASSEGPECRPRSLS